MTKNEKTNDASMSVFSFDNEWDMEQCKKKFALYKNKTFFSPNGDREWVYQLARMEFLHRVILEYKSSNDETCIKVYREFIHKFFKENHITRLSPKMEIMRNRIRNKLHLPLKINCYRTLDTAIRNYAILIDIYRLKEYDGIDLLSDSQKQRLLSELDFPIKHLREFDYISNWGIIIVSLSIASKALSDMDVSEKEYSILENMLAKQIKPDGGHIECSTMYHMQIVICLMRMVFWLREKHKEVKPFITEYLRKMIDWAYTVCDGNGFQLMYGDSDYTNINTVLFLANTVFDIRSVQPLGYGDIEPDYILLIEFFPLYEVHGVRIQPRRRIEKRNSLMDGVWVYDDDLWTVRAYNEDAISGHKHADNLSFNLHYQNLPVIMDSGRMTYYNKQSRVCLRGPLAHNVALVDGGKCWGVIYDWFTENHPQIITNHTTEINGFVTYCGSYQIKYGEGVARFYRCISIINEAIVVADLVEDEHGEKLKSILNFWKDVAPDENGFRVCNTDLQIYGNGIVTLEPSVYSLHYNEKSTGMKSVNCNAFSNGTAKSMMIICTDKIKVHTIREDTCIVGNQKITFCKNRENGNIIAIEDLYK